MTTEKMPDVIWAQAYLHPDDGKTLMIDAYPESGDRLSTYLRAEPVEALLRQAREVLRRLRKAATTQDHVNAIHTIAAIDKFLGEKK